MIFSATSVFSVVQMLKTLLMKRSQGVRFRRRRTKKAPPPGGACMLSHAASSGGADWQNVEKRIPYRFSTRKAKTRIPLCSIVQALAALE
jgi:hypothetical protein